MRLFGVGLLIKSLWPREELISAVRKRYIAPWEAFGFGVGPFERGIELSIYRRSPGGPIEARKICLVAEKICMEESDRGKWVVKSAFGIVKHGGVTPINLGKSRPPP
ncbi:unnamed protein product [Prunus brigantina]